MDITEILASIGAAHTVTIEPYAGPTASGHSYDAAVTVTPCWVDDKRRLLRDNTGAQVIAQTTVYAALDTDCPPRSRITLHDGRVTTVLAVFHRDGGGLDVPEHVEIMCQ